MDNESLKILSINILVKNIDKENEYLSGSIIIFSSGISKQDETTRSSSPFLQHTKILSFEKYEFTHEYIVDNKLDSKEKGKKDVDLSLSTRG